MLRQELIQRIPTDFDDNSKVWVFQSSRAFIEKEAKEIDEQLYQFYSQWESHGAPVKGWAKLLFRQFIVVLADDTKEMIGGCSTDGLMRQIKSIERQYDVNLFDPMMITFLIKEKAEMLPFSQVQYAIDKGYISRETLLFNNVVYTKKDLMEKWLVSLGESWLANRVTFI